MNLAASRALGAYVPPKSRSTFTGLHGVVSQGHRIFHSQHNEDLRSGTVWGTIPSLPGKLKNNNLKHLVRTNNIRGAGSDIRTSRIRSRTAIHTIMTYGVTEFHSHECVLYTGDLHDLSLFKTIFLRDRFTSKTPPNSVRGSHLRPHAMNYPFSFCLITFSSQSKNCIRRN
jgi:hypothetical protein